MVRREATRLREAAMWIGRATAYAYRCPVSELQPVDPGDRQRYVRDSDAWRGSLTRSRRQIGEHAVPPAMPPPSASSCGRGASTPVAPASGSTSGAASAKGGSAARSAAAAAVYARRAQIAKQARSPEAARSEAIVTEWLASRPPTTVAPVGAAAERFAALRARIIAKQG
jgi:hypothetical protein